MHIHTVIAVVASLVILLTVIQILVVARLTWRKRYSDYTFILILNSDFVYYYHRKSGNTIIHVSDCCNPLDSIYKSLLLCLLQHMYPKLNSNQI